jgi:hypothetical protein
MILLIIMLIKIIIISISIGAKLPNHRSGWGVSISSDLEICLYVLELIHMAAGGEGVKVLIHMLKITAAKGVPPIGGK